MHIHPDYPTHKCFTACGFLIVHDQILLVKHKKLGIWLAPGGHLEPNELPHKTAEREVLEETGLKTRAVNNSPLNTIATEEYFPVPFAVNLHWISEKNYAKRVKTGQTDRITSEKWPKGCEQHVAFLYLMAPLGSLDFRENLEETDGIGWFTPKEAIALDTTAGMKAEVTEAFKITKNPK